ncbi:MAG: hypothetical protein GXO48_05840 [Chlorobi bacterium]|nr:hypothetical protein [Chlorobiota bacterium]
MAKTKENIVVQFKFIIVLTKKSIKQLFSYELINPSLCVLSISLLEDAILRLSLEVPYSPIHFFINLPYEGWEFMDMAIGFKHCSVVQQLRQD